MKRIFVLLMCILLCFSALCACGEGSVSSGNDNMREKEAEGYECHIIQHENSDAVGYSLKQENPFGYVQGTSFADEALNRFKEIEESTGCSILFKSTAKDYANMATSIAACDEVGDILFSASVCVVQQFARSEALYPIDELGVIDFTQTDKYGTPNIWEVSSYNGHPYAISPSLWPLRQARVISVFMIDTKLTSSYNLTNPHEYLENRTWGWEGVEELMSTYHIKDGDFELKALGTRNMDFLKLAVFGNGVKLVIKDSEGNFSSNVGDANMIEAIQWTNDIYRNYLKAFVDPGTPSWDSVTKDYVSRKSIAALIPTSIVYNTMIYEIDEFSIVPFPTGPKGVYGEWPGVLEASDTLGVLTSADDENIAANILVMLAEPFESIPDYDSLVDYYATNVFFSRDDAEIILGISKNAQYSYWPFSGADATFWQKFTDNLKLDNAVQTMQKHIDAFKLYIEENIIPNQPVYDLINR